jgi:hypothetical protein
MASGMTAAGRLPEAAPACSGAGRVPFALRSGDKNRVIGFARFRRAAFCAGPRYFFSGLAFFKSAKSCWSLASAAFSAAISAFCAAASRAAAPSSCGPARSQRHKSHTGSNPIGGNASSTARWHDAPRGTRDELRSYVRLDLPSV